MAVIQTLVLLMSALVASGQRPFYAGSRPIGYPEVLNKTTTPSGLEDKFGEGTTQRLPIEAQGDRDLVDRLSKLPIDKQPFWFINWQAYEANRQKPQTFPQRPSIFNEGSINEAPAVANPATSSNSGSGINVKETNANVDYRYGTENNNAGTTSTNTGTEIRKATELKNGSTEIKPVGVASSETNNDPKKPKSSAVQSEITLSDPIIKNTGLHSGRKDINEKTVANTQIENDYEDIEVRKYIKTKQV